ATLGNTRNGGHDLAGSAIPALKGILLDESPLHRTQDAILVRDALDGPDTAALRSGRERQASEHGDAVDVHRTRPALTLVATFFRAGQVKMLAQHVEHRGTDV